MKTAPITLTLAAAALLCGCVTPEQLYNEAHGLYAAKRYSEALPKMQEAADAEFVPAQLALAKSYDFGQGVAKNPTRAAYWYRKAAMNGDPNAQDNLGLCYYFGSGVKKDLPTAVKWHQRAADQGYAPAWNNLGLCYRNGEGVAQDEIRAADCFRKAAELGNDAGQYNLGRCYYHGVGVVQNLEQARFWIERSAAQGYKNARLFMQDNNWQ